MNIAPTLLLAAVLSSLCWAALDALRKSIAQELDATTLVAAFSLGQAPIFALWWYLDGGSIDFGNYWIPGLSALALNILANLLFVRSVQISEFSVVVPLLAFTPVFSTLAAMPLLGEYPSALQALGVVVVVAGAWVLGLAPSASEASRWRDPGVWMMLLVAAAWSLTTVLDKSATHHAPLAFHALIQTGVLGALLWVYIAARSSSRAPQNLAAELPRLTLAIAAAAAAFGLQLFALRGMDAGLVETQKRIIGLMMALLLGRALFAETLDRAKWVGVGILTLGTALTILGSGLMS